MANSEPLPDPSGPQQPPAAAMFDVRWLERRQEDILLPDLPVIDPHHHFWYGSHQPSYRLEDLLADVGSGHHVLATVFVECREMYRAHGPEALRSLGQTEFVNGIAAMSASGLYGTCRVCAGIIGAVDLRLGERARPVLEAHVAAAGGRLKGIRQIGARDADSRVRVSGPIPPPALYSDSAFRAGFAHLAPLGLAFDAWLYHPQLNELHDLAAHFPQTRIVLNHLGGPIGIGPYQGKRDEVAVQWERAMRHLAQLPNVWVKLGGLGMKLGGFDFSERPEPPSSVELAAAWRPSIETCIDVFGAQRCMFESNFPVDKRTCSYPVLWNAFKRIAGNYSVAEIEGLFAGNAARCYRLDGQGLE